MKKEFRFLLLLMLLIGVFAFSALADQPVYFPDENLEFAIRQKLNHYEKPIFRSQLLDIVELDLRDQNINSLEGIEYFRNLEVLNLRNNNINDVTPLATLTNLRILDFGYNNLGNLSLAHFDKLSSHHIIELNLDHNQYVGTTGEVYRLSDIGHLSGFNHLQKLSLEANRVESLMPLENMQSLKEINLKGNRLTGLMGLEKLKNLESVNFSNNQITDISAINNLNNLEYLNLRENNVVDIYPLSNLYKLKYLNLHSNTNIVDVAPIQDLQSLDTLILRNVPINDQTIILEGKNNLKRLNIRNTGVDDLSVLGRLMSAGALQDDFESNVVASLNLLDLNNCANEGDLYFPVRLYWDNISDRYPINLPYVQSDIDSVGFSHETGFYDQDFLLSLVTDVPKSRIYYTLDGSDPALTADFVPLGSTKIYQSPIYIYDRSSESNYLAEIRTSMVQDSFHIPVSNINKAFVVRAIVVNDNGLRSNVVTHTYFVGEHINDHYSLPIVSIATNDAYLFGDELGIYVPGVFYEDLGQSWFKWFYPANFTQRGQIWERPASFQLINQKGENLVSRNIGVRIHGGATRSYPQKSLRLYFTDNYDATDGVYFPYFSEFSRTAPASKDPVFKSLILRNAGNDWFGSMFRDALAQDLLVHTELDLQDNFPVIVFINGEYWGIHNLRPRYDEAYFQTKYDISVDELLVLVEYWGRTQIGRPGEKEEYFDLLRMIDNDYSENDYATVDTLADQTAYNEIVDLLDIENFIDYFVSQIYFGNRDWPHNNIMFWKTVNHQKSYDQQSYWYDGKWRWIVFDLDMTFDNVEQDALAFATAENEWSTYLLRSLLENQTFREKFINSFADHLNTTFREDVVAERVDVFKSVYQPEIEEHIHRWGNAGGSLETWLDQVDQIMEFAQLRPKIQREHIISYFNLPGLAQVTTSVNPLQGYVRINSVDLIEGYPGVEDASHWTGIYFKDISIRLSAIPYEGYEFSHWEMNTQMEIYDQILEIMPEEDIQVQAVFKPFSTD